MSFFKRAWAEVHLDRLYENADNFKKNLKGDSELMCVVKADCYGHGSPDCAVFLQKELGVKWFAVSNLNEAIELRNGGITEEILILGYTPPEYAQALSENNIIQAITEKEYAQLLSQNTTSPVRCHIKLDTGMTRIGVRCKDVCEFKREIEEICNLENISVEGIFTHLCVADSNSVDDVRFTEKQISLFNEIYSEIKESCPAIVHHHYLNSAGGILHDNGDSTLARLGIVLYGLKPDYELEIPFELKPAMELKAVVSQVKTVEADVEISYGRTFKTDKEIKLATVSIGYADGVPRALSNKGELLVKGKRAKIVGRVCMDQLMIDVTGIDVKAGDIATVFGNDGEESITADDIARSCGTIGYEIICNITKRVPRVYHS
ncbi:MAG: alanine racemase [Ruminococcus sp.]|nr:alanine racemase [Ruminococcus sp.]